MKKHIITHYNIGTMEKKITQTIKAKKNNTARNSTCLVTAIALAALLLISSPIYAQYESFFGDESWEYNIDYLKTCYTNDYNPNVFGACCCTNKFKFYKNDTIRIGNHIFFKSNLTQGVYLREDTVSGRLYGRYSTVETDDEYLLCDMSLSVGDTFTIPEGIWGLGGDMHMVVDSVVLVSGKKIIHLTLNKYYDCFFGTSSVSYMTNYNISLRFMEGIGPMFGICPTSFFSYENDLGLLLCLHKDDTLNYMTHETLGCAQFGAGVPDYPQHFIHVYPNPVDEQIIIEFPTTKEIHGSVMVRDMTGRVCRQFTVDKNICLFDISSLPRGAYLLTFTGEDNRKITKKIMKR